MQNSLWLSLALAGTLWGQPADSPAAPSPQRVAEATTVQPAYDHLIVPNQRLGPITPYSSEQSLRAHFGAENVRREKIYVGEGQAWDGVAVFPDQPDQRVEVLWNPEDPNRVEMVQLLGSTSRWRTAEGVSLGTSLLELQQLNGRPFELFGLSWDFSGAVCDWKGGALEGLILSCDDTELPLSEEESAAISGDRVLSSDLPLLQRANPKVSKIVVVFLEPEAETPQDKSPTQ